MNKSASLYKAVILLSIAHHRHTRWPFEYTAVLMVSVGSTTIGGGGVVAGGESHSSNRGARWPHLLFWRRRCCRGKRGIDKKPERAVARNGCRETRAKSAKKRKRKTDQSLPEQFLSTGLFVLSSLQRDFSKRVVSRVTGVPRLA